MAPVNVGRTVMTASALLSYRYFGILVHLSQLLHQQVLDAEQPKHQHLVEQATRTEHECGGCA